MTKRALRLLIVAAAVVALGGCSSSSTPVGGDQHQENIHARLVSKAHLEPCPSSSASAAPRGLPNVTLACLGNGPAVHLAGLTGKPTVVNVWGSWCIPCQAEAAVLSSVFDADRGRVRFLGVDTADDVNSALDFGTHVSPPVRYPSVVDPDKKVLLGLARSPGPPLTAFISAAGAVVHVKVGPYTNAAVLRSDIATYLHV
ncbi:MAG: TlpA family protein disulfide reductase [Mycobacteriales bacterium]